MNNFVIISLVYEISSIGEPIRVGMDIFIDLKVQDLSLVQENLDFLFLVEVDSD